MGSVQPLGRDPSRGGVAALRDDASLLEDGELLRGAGGNALCRGTAVDVEVVHSSRWSRGVLPVLPSGLETRIGEKIGYKMRLQRS